MIYSHYYPGAEEKYKLLKNHLKEVYDGMQSMAITLRDVGIVRRPSKLELMLTLIAYLHDIGKATSYFQKYLQKKRLHVEIPPQEQTLSRHSLLGATLFIFLSEQFELSAMEKLTLYRVIVSHHSSFHKNADKMTLDAPQLKMLRKQYTDICSNPESQEIMAFVGERIGITLPDKDEFVAFVGSDHQSNLSKAVVLLTLGEMGSSNQDIDYHSCLYFFLLSMLNRADKHSASLYHAYDMPKINLEVFKRGFTPSDIESYLASKKKSFPTNDRMSAIRDDFFTVVKNNVQGLDLDKHLITIHAPTGVGKTLSLLNSALILQKRLKQERDTEYRIIYCLPFLSIIDQVSDEVKNIAKRTGQPIDWNLLQEHHHLATPVTPDKTDEEDLREDQIQLLASFWDSQIVISTFVALLETYSDSKQSIKLVSLANSIIMIDEVQSIDAGLYSYVKWFVSQLAKFFNAYVIISSATMPECFVSDEFCSLIGPTHEIEKPFKALNRYEIKRAVSYSFEGFGEKLLEVIQENEDKKILVVTNTKKTAYLLAEWLLGKGVELRLLTSLIIPYHRNKIIHSFKQNQKPNVLISTQLIEAGVDLSVDIIFRFFAPLDSIIQAAGRTNRSYENIAAKGIVHLIDMEYNNEKKDYNSVYLRNSYRSDGDLRIASTFKLLNKREMYEEKEMFQIGKEYFASINNPNYWHATYNMLRKNNLEDFGDRTRIIVQDQQTRSVIVITGSWASEVEALLDERDALLSKLFDESQNSFTVKAQLRENMRKISPYMLSVTDSEAKKLNEFPGDDSYRFPIRDQYDELLGLMIYEEITAVSL